jgi:hypothetical protein
MGYKRLNKFTYSPKLFKAKLSKYFFSNRNTYSFLVFLIDFYFENNNVLQIHTYIPKIQKKESKKKTLLSSILKVCSILRSSVIFLYEVIFVIHCYFQNKNLYQNYQKSICSHLKIFFFDSLALKPLGLEFNRPSCSLFTI